MGTRHSILVQVDNDYKVANYGQWDGYPGGQGVGILKFLREEMDREKFITAVRHCTEASRERLEEIWLGLGARKDGDSYMMSSDVSDKYQKLYPHLHRDCGSDILKLIQDAGGLELKLDKNFPGDSLFCEWAYVIDLDKNTFEVYEGFNKEPLDPQERFAMLKSSDARGEYYPVRFKHAWSLDALPTQEEFLAILEPEQDEDEDEDEEKDAAE